MSRSERGFYQPDGQVGIPHPIEMNGWKNVPIQESNQPLISLNEINQLPDGLSFVELKKSN